MNYLKAIPIFIFVVLSANKIFSQEEILYEFEDIKELTASGKEIKTNLTFSELKEIKNYKLYIVEFEEFVLMKEKIDDRWPLRLNKTKTSLNSTYYFVKESEYSTWRLKITSYPWGNKLRVEVESPLKEDSSKTKIIVLYLEEE